MVLECCCSMTSKLIMVHSLHVSTSPTINLHKNRKWTAALYISRRFYIWCSILHGKWLSDKQTMVDDHGEPEQLSWCHKVCGTLKNLAPPNKIGCCNMGFVPLSKICTHRYNS